LTPIGLIGLTKQAKENTEVLRYAQDDGVEIQDDGVEVRMTALKFRMTASI